MGTIQNVDKENKKETQELTSLSFDATLLCELKQNSNNAFHRIRIEMNHEH